MSAYWLMSFELAFLGMLQHGPRLLGPFLTRKLCHTVSGACMLFLNPSDLHSRVFVYLVSIVSLLMTWELYLHKLWFGSSRDIGITIYLILVAVWFSLQLPTYVLAPVFFADPAGAVFGKLMTRFKLNKRWFGDKTVAGTFAVFLVAFWTLAVRELAPRVALAALTALVEAIGGRYDNLFIAIVSIFGWGGFQKM